MHPADLNLATEVTGFQRYLFLSLPAGGADGELAWALEALGEALENMHEVAGQPAPAALRRGRFQYLRAEPALSVPRDVPHPSVLSAQALIRLEGSRLTPLVRYEQGLRNLIAAHEGTVETLAGMERPRSYTSHAMAQFAYAPALEPQSGVAHPLGVVIPQNKTRSWWEMGWMQRESFFLPRFDASGQQVAKGHALSAAPGIPYLVRRTVHTEHAYGIGAGYDFVSYFEFAEAHAPVFREVMAALRDERQNPEWAFVREGPEWWGRRVERAAELWAQ